MAEVEQTADDFTEEAETAETDWKAEAEKYKALSRKVEDRAKSNAAAAKELAALRASSMSDTERAVAEAKAVTAAAAGKRLARAEIRAAAAGKVAPEALEAFFEFADLGKFVGDDGEPDDSKISAAVARLGTARAASFDGGARTPADKPHSMSAQIRKQAGFGQ